MTEQELRTIIRSNAAETVQMAIENVKDDSHFRHDLSFDSLDDVEFAIKLEDELHIDAESAEITELRTVNDLYDHLVTKGLVTIE